MHKTLLLVYLFFTLHKILQSIEVSRKPLTDLDALWIKCEETFFYLTPCSEFFWFRWICLGRSVGGRALDCPVESDQLPLQQPRPYYHTNSQVLLLTL